MRLFHSIDNPISRNTFAAARVAVGTALTAAGGLLIETPHAFVIARPPGHHADRLEAMGFCFFNTIACVAEWLLEAGHWPRLISTSTSITATARSTFEEREDVYYVSIHRYPFYPGTGAVSEIGVGAGRGFTRNIPMNGGVGDAAYLRATEDVVLRVIDGYRPSVILISAGFDAHRRDPLGGMNVTEHAFGEMTRRVVEAAQRHSAGRVLSLLEGGYDMEGLAASVEQHLIAMA